MKLQKRQIIIDKKKLINLYEQTLFLADGGEGLHLWESSVVLSRYITKNPQLFNNKEIIELGCGCGLLGIVCLMYTNCFKLTFSDYQESVLNNLLSNISLNKINHTHLTEEKWTDNPFCLCTGCYPGRYSLLKLDWRDYDNYKLESYDFIIGSELIYSGGHIEELAKIIRNLLKKDGKALITMPEKRSMTKLFLQYLDENELQCSYKYMEELSEDIFDNILGDEKESKKYFENLKSMKIMLYEITRK